MENIKITSVKSCVKKIPFSPREKKLLITLVKDHPIIEDKRTSINNIMLKRRAWDQITNVYNTKSFVTKRTSIQLKRCWENMKSLRKKERAEQSRGSSKTSEEIERIDQAQDQTHKVEANNSKEEPSKETCNVTANIKNITSEVELQIKRCRRTIEQEEELYKWRLRREQLLVQREEKLQLREEKLSQLEVEQKKLQNEKLKLEILFLKQKIEN